MFHERGLRIRQKRRFYFNADIMAETIDNIIKALIGTKTLIKEYGSKGENT